MKYLLTSLLLVALAAKAEAQTSDVVLGSQRRQTRLSIQPTYQRYEDEHYQVEEWSVPLFAVVSPYRNLQISLLASLARASGEVAGTQMKNVSGLNDLQLSVNYARRIGLGSLVFNLGMNTPTGKTSLTQAEFETVQLLSRDYYNFQVPSFGQGVNVSPSLTWAIPLGKDVMLGVGAAYQYRSSYAPYEAIEDEYNPGNEFLLTGGMDLRLGANTALSGDLSYAIYDSDIMAGEKVFEAGNKTSITLQLLNHLGFNELRLVGRYRSRAKSNLLSSALTAPSERETLPTLGLLLGSYQFRIAKYFYLTAQGQGRYYGKTDLASSKMIGKVELLPQVRTAGRWSITPRLAYTFGSFSGWEGGLGIGLRL